LPKFEKNPHTGLFLSAGSDALLGAFVYMEFIVASILPAGHFNFYPVDSVIDISVRSDFSIRQK
jgi:hypothetical protein